jgi:hypothetical protein
VTSTSFMFSISSVSTPEPLIMCGS